MYVHYVPAYYLPMPLPILPPYFYSLREQFCTYCGHPLDWIQQVSQWHCSRCKIYYPIHRIEQKKSLF